METVHTPRLCIDGRIASEAPDKGLIASELIDQLVSGRGEENASSSWIEKHRTVLLSHPTQVFSGQLKRFDTKHRTPWEPISWIWEKTFLKRAQISAFHRFRPIDQLHPTPRCETITTLLPPAGGLPFFISRRTNQFYVVPCQAARKILTKDYQVEPEQIFVTQPAIRRALHFIEKPQVPDEEYLLVLLGDRDGKERYRGMQNLLSEKYPHLKRKVFSLSDREVVQPGLWVKLLQGAKLCLYLESQPFDWATLALESLYWGVPTLFTDTHQAMNEMLPHSALRLSEFLLNLPELTELKFKAQTAYIQLEALGAFDPLALAKQYTGIYEKLCSK